MKKPIKTLLLLYLTALTLCACSGKAADTSDPSYEAEPASSAQGSQSVSESRSPSETQHGSDISEQSEADTSVVYRLSDKYFVSRLEQSELSAFCQIYTAAFRHQDSVKLSEPVDEKTLDSLMMLLNYDCPELIHVLGDYSTVYSDDTRKYVSSVRLYYNMSAEEYSKGMKQLVSLFSKLKTAVNGMSAYEKEKYVYDMIFSRCIYDEQDKDSGSAYGALIGHRARCEGISKALMWCLRELDISCITVVGKPGWETETVYPIHSWNLAEIDGSWYHVDLTADDLNIREGQDNTPLYGFLNCNDDVIYQTRTLHPLYEEMDVPECSSDELNYHVQYGLLIKDGEDPRKRLSEIFDRYYTAGEITGVSIRLETREMYDEVLPDWEDMLKAELSARGTEEYEDTIFYNSVSRTVALFIMAA